MAALRILLARTGWMTLRLDLRLFLPTALRALPVLLLVSLPARGALDWSGVYEKTIPSVPVLVMSGGYCSGALIEKDLILTAAHCVDRLRPLSVSWAGHPENFEDARVVALRGENDLALVRLFKPRETKPLQVLPKNYAMKVGEPVATVGHPATPEFRWDALHPFKKDETFLISAGLVSGLSEDNLITDMSLTPGNSGGPVLDREGRVVAVVSRKRIGPAVGAIGFASHHSTVHEFLEEHRKSGDQEIPFYKAKWSFEFLLGFASGSLLKSELETAEEKKAAEEGKTGYAFGAYSAEFRLAFFDRLYLGYSTTFGESPRLESAIMGPKLLFVLQSKHTITFSPLLEYGNLKYKRLGALEETREEFLFYSLYFRWSQFPLGFKLSFMPRKGETEILASILIPFG